MLRSMLCRMASLLAALVLAGCGTPYATVPSAVGRPVMLLGHDPVAYFTRGQPTRGDPALRVDLPDRSYLFASPEHQLMFEADPARYEPQYGGFCASGAAYGIKLGSDPTAWAVRDGRLFIFGDVLGQAAWSLDPAWHIDHADRLWPGLRERGWRGASLAAYLHRVPHYRSGAELRAEWLVRHPGQAYPDYDPGSLAQNLLAKPPGWRAAEGVGQPALGYPR